jgi:hypothetical protein
MSIGGLGNGDAGLSVGLTSGRAGGGAPASGGTSPVGGDCVVFSSLIDTLDRLCLPSGPDQCLVERTAMDREPEVLPRTGGHLETGHPAQVTVLDLDGRPA